MDSENRLKQMYKIDALFDKLGLDPAAVADESITDAPLDVPPCAVCGGLGMVYPDVHVTDPMYGKVIDCPAGCEAVLSNREMRRVGQMRKINQIVGRDASPQTGIVLGDYQPQSQYQEFAFEIAQVFCKRLCVQIGDSPEKNWLIFVGQTGAGKTFLSSVISNELEARGHVCWYMKFSDMLRKYRNAWKDPDATYTPYQFVKALQSVEILVLDDVHDKNISESAESLFLDVIDVRMDNNRPTVFTTNLLQKDMARVLGFRTESRMTHMAHWVQMDGTVRDTSGVI
jgi:DNA replication protein DnaC